MDSLFRIHQSTNKGNEMVSKITIQFILEWIENHLEQRVSIEDITRLSGYSRRHIQQLFKKYTNISLGEYIRRRKLCRAAALVRLTSMSMLDIAILMSFDSRQSFSREYFDALLVNIVKKTPGSLSMYVLHVLITAGFYRNVSCLY